MMTLSMDHQRRKDIFSCSLVVLVIALLSSNAAMGNNVVFGVKHRYGGRKNSLPSQLKAHDAKRHGRALASVALPLGGDDRVTDAALYYTKLSIGSDPVDYHVQVDTGSDILWVNCKGCDTCPEKSSLGLQMKLYDAKNSSSNSMISCDDTFCKNVYEGTVIGCGDGQPCTYTITYADSSGSQGYFVSDIVNFDQVIGDNKTKPTTGKISFGCSFGHSGSEGTSTDRVDGIVGFGQKDTSIISQLASQDKTKRIFSHCLDGDVGGGIFAIGEVMETNLQVTPMDPDTTHYTVKLKEIEIDGETINVQTDGLLDFGRKTVIDSGATLAHLPETVYEAVFKKIFEKKPKTEFFPYSKFECFHYLGNNIDRDYPEITFHFKHTASMRIFPHEYLLEINDKGQWCIGWQKGGMKNDEGNEMIILGDIVLSNKLVVYDLENQTIGWTEYNCSSSIKVKDEDSGEFYSVEAHLINPNSATAFKQNVFTFIIMLAMAAMLVF